MKGEYPPCWLAFQSGHDCLLGLHRGSCVLKSPVLLGSSGRLGSTRQMLNCSDWESGHLESSKGASEAEVLLGFDSSQGDLGIPGLLSIPRKSGLGMSALSWAWPLASQTLKHTSS